MLYLVHLSRNAVHCPGTLLVLWLLKYCCSGSIVVLYLIPQTRSLGGNYFWRWRCGEIEARHLYSLFYTFMLLLLREYL